MTKCLGSAHKNHCQSEISQWNATPLLKRGSNFSFFAALYLSCRGFNSLLALLTKEGGNKSRLPIIIIILIARFYSLTNVAELL